jgi:hypothetical protein
LGPEADVRHLPCAVRGVAAGHLWPRPRAAGPSLHVLLHRLDGVRHLRRLHLLPARALPDAPARHRIRLHLQHRPHHRSGRSVLRRLDRGGGRRRSGCRAQHALLCRVRAAHRPARHGLGDRDTRSQDPGLRRRRCNG